MNKYVALLRGINFGGNNKIEMSKLKDTFYGLGFTDVHTYLNSGNVVFSDISNTIENIVPKIEASILEVFMLAVRVIVIDFDNIKNILDNIPESWSAKLGMRPHIAFLWEEIDNPNIINQIASNIDSEYIKYIPGVILWNVELKNWSKDKVYRFINSKMISKHATIRSINTVKAICKILEN